MRLGISLEYCEHIRVMAYKLRDSGKNVLDTAEMGRFLAVDMAFYTLMIPVAGNSRITKLVTESKVLTGCLSQTICLQNIHYK